jgi:hypothetical protein
MKNVTTALLAALLVLAPMAASAAVPGTISFTGRVADAGAPVTGDHTLTFKLFDDPATGTELWTETKTVTVQDGVLAVALGEATALSPGLFNGSPLYLEVTVDATVMSPRMAIQSVPYAIKAGTADVALSAQSVACAAPPCIADTEIVGIPGSKVTSAVSNATNAAYATDAGYATNAGYATTAGAAGDLVCSGCVADAEIVDVSGSKVSGTVASATNATNATNATTAANATNVTCAGACVQDAEIQSVSAAKVVGTVGSATNAAAVPWTGVTGKPTNFAYTTTSNAYPVFQERFFHSAYTAGTVIVTAGSISLVRDGTYGGLMATGTGNVYCTGVPSTGGIVSFQAYISASAGTAVFTNAQGVNYVTCMIGNPSGNGSIAELTYIRYNADWWWTGFMRVQQDQ